jgi:hypothetical protein
MHPFVRDPACKIHRPPPFWRDSYDAAENAALPSWGRAVLANNLLFHANVKIVKIYTFMVFNF